MIVSLALVLAAATILLFVVRAALLGYSRTSFRGRVLSAPEQAIIAAAADALFPHAGPIPLSGTEAGLVAYMDDSLADLQPGTRFLIRVLFFFVEHGPWVFGPRRRRFTRLTHDERIEALRTMQTSRVYFRRVAFLSLRTLLSIAYLANERVADRIGMTPHPAPFEAKRRGPAPSLHEAPTW
jgi:hypothetical protein